VRGDDPIGKNQREQIKAAAADYAASRVEGQFGDRWWEMPQSFPLSQAADLLHDSADWLRELVEHPLAEAASRTGAAGPILPIEFGIAANFVTARLTEPIEAAARVCEVAGIVIGLGAGVPPLAIACAKLYAHDELGRMLSREFEQIINSIGAEREVPPERDTGPQRQADCELRERREAREEVDTGPQRQADRERGDRPEPDAYPR
jgi:hypothetical protein